VLALLLHFSAAVSRHSDQIKVLAQRLALLEERQRRTEQPEDLNHELQPVAEIADKVPATSSRNRVTG
jgi:hypothetical protein